MLSIADTGFLVAFAASRDMHHDWAVGVANELSEPALACEAVLAETAFKLRSVEVVLEMIASELVKVSFDLNDHLPQLTALAKRYADRQPDLADLCLIRMSELYPHHRVITAGIFAFAQVEGAELRWHRTREHCALSAMLTVSQLSKSFAGRALFDDVSLQVNRGDRIGLVGPNGAGKSTLFALLLGDVSPDKGTIAIEKNATIGFLPQETAAAGDETVLELALAVSPELVHAQKVIKEHEAAVAGIADPGADAAYHDALHVFDEHGGWELEPKAKRVLAGLAFRETDFDRPARALSGGWIMRAHLARLLVMEPDLLLLDEPTNHLDLESLQWFQEYLRSYPGAIVMISHDREFLNQLVGSIVEIAHSKLVRYRGNWDNYVEERAAREEQQLAAYKNQQKEIASLQLFADRFRAKASKASQAQSKLKQIDRMKKIAAPVARGKTIKFHFPQPVRSGLRVITLKDVDHAYGDVVVYRGMQFHAERGQRTVLVGPNGAGKSTLLKLLAGVLPVQHGVRELGHNVRTGYFSQNRIDVLNASHTVLDSARDMPNPVSEQTARTVLGSFLFRGDDVFKTVSVLSGGEKSRLALVRLLLDPPNLLLMDEPTTHLDVGSIDALIGALKQYHGTLIFISHDVHFIRAIATSVLHVTAGAELEREAN